MSEERTTLEVIAPTVDEAITKGLNDLGLPEEAVEIEVLDQGSRGIFGIGSRQARIRLTIKNQPLPTHETVQRPTSVMVREPPAPEVLKEAAPSPVQSKPAQVELEVEDHDLRIARETVSEILDKMGVQAQVTARYIEVSDPKDVRQILVEIHGNDLSILIGRKSETLNALQYISSLIIGKELGKWVPLQIDVEGYRMRRERILRQLARRMADQAISTGRRQVLEPMPANERRVIHMELRDHPEVITESIGEEPNRKVTIVLKK